MVICMYLHDVRHLSNKPDVLFSDRLMPQLLVPHSLSLQCGTHLFEHLRRGVVNDSLTDLQLGHVVHIIQVRP